VNEFVAERKEIYLYPANVSSVDKLVLQLYARKDITSPLSSLGNPVLNGGWHLPTPQVTDPQFIQVINHGTPEYRDLKMGEIIKGFDVEFFVKKFFVEGNTDHSRGNVRASFGITSNAGQGKRTIREIHLHFGASFPSMMKDNNLPEVQDAFLRVSLLARMLGVKFAQDGIDPQISKRLDEFARKIHPANIWEACTVAFLLLEGKTHLIIHFDKPNCYILQESLMVRFFHLLPSGS
jgi:hypothetical protein